MPNLIINGVTFDGTPAAPTNPFKPTDISTKIVRVGRALPGKDGTQRWVHRGSKFVFTITWAPAHLATLNATRAIWALASSFTFVDQYGGSRTVICSGEDDYTEEFAFAEKSGVSYYNLSLTLRQV